MCLPLHKKKAVPFARDVLVFINQNNIRKELKMIICSLIYYYQRISIIISWEKIINWHINKEGVRMRVQCLGFVLKLPPNNNKHNI